MEFEVSESQLKLRKNALDRQTELAASGLITSTQLENTTSIFIIQAAIFK